MCILYLGTLCVYVWNICILHDAYVCVYTKLYIKAINYLLSYYRLFVQHRI